MQTATITTLDIALNYAMTPTQSGRRASDNLKKGVLLIIVVKVSDITPSPDKFPVALIHKPGEMKQESEALLKGLRIK